MVAGREVRCWIGWATCEEKDGKASSTFRKLAEEFLSVSAEEEHYLELNLRICCCCFPFRKSWTLSVLWL